MSSIVTQLFYLTQLVGPDDMNTMYNDIGQKINAYFPLTPSIMSGLNYTQTGTSNVITTQQGSVRWVDQANVLSTTPQFTFTIIDPVTNLAVTCPVSATQKYIVAKVTKTTVNTTFISLSGAILTTAYTLAEISGFATPDEYAPLWTITNTAGVYTIGTDANCAFNYGNILNINLSLYAKLASPNFTGIPTAPTAPVGTNSPQLATMAALINSGSGIIASGSNANGSWVRFQNGMVIQVGLFTLAPLSSGMTVNFPTPMPNANWRMACMGQVTEGVYFSYQTNTLTSFFAQAWINVSNPPGAIASATWIAIGGI